MTRKKRVWFPLLLFNGLEKSPYHGYEVCVSHYCGIVSKLGCGLHCGIISGLMS